MPSSVSRFSRESEARYAISVVFLVFGTLVGGWLPHIPDVKRQLGANYDSVGNALVCSGLGAVISMQILGTLIHRFGSRNVSLVSGFGACLLVPTLLLQKTLLGLSVNLFAVGICYGALDAAMNSHAVRVQALHPRSILAGIHGWFSFGGILGGAIAALAVKLSIAPFPHLVASSIFLAVLLIGTRTFLLPSDADKDSDGPKFIIPRGTLLLLGILCACAFVAEGGILDWSALYVGETLHASAIYWGMMTGLCSGCMAAGRFVGDSLLHRFGDQHVLLASGIVSTLGILGGVNTSSIWLSMVSFAIACLGIANMAPIFFKGAGNIPGLPTGSGVAALTTCGYGGFLLGPPLIGKIAHRESLSVGLGSLAVLVIAVTLCSGKFDLAPTQ